MQQNSRAINILTFDRSELSSSCDLASNDSFEGEPEEKRRKTTNVVIDQPATEHKVLIDNVPDQSSLLDEVRHFTKVKKKVINANGFSYELCNTDGVPSHFR